MVGIPAYTASVSPSLLLTLTYGKAGFRSNDGDSLIGTSTTENATLRFQIVVMICLIFCTKAGTKSHKGFRTKTEKTVGAESRPDRLAAACLPNVRLLCLVDSWVCFPLRAMKMHKGCASSGHLAAVNVRSHKFARHPFAFIHSQECRSSCSERPADLVAFAVAHMHELRSFLQNVLTVMKAVPHVQVNIGRSFTSACDNM